jgi:hypothetical protein
MEVKAYNSGAWCSQLREHEERAASVGADLEDVTAILLFDQLREFKKLGTNLLRLDRGTSHGNVYEIRWTRRVGYVLDSSQQWRYGRQAAKRL